MNLNEFERTNYSGLYISKETHPEFGRKYIVRFQHDKKRYVKVLGYTKKDNLTRKDAIELMQSFKDSIISKTEEKTTSNASTASASSSQKDSVSAAKPSTSRSYTRPAAARPSNAWGFRL